MSKVFVELSMSLDLRFRVVKESHSARSEINS